MPPPDPLRAGGHRSLQILGELADARIRSLGARRAGRAVGELAWEPAQSSAIQRREVPAWHAGHVTALLSRGADLLAASQTGGVWLLHEVLEPTPLAGYLAAPLSDAWDSPDVSCLAWDPQGTSVFVGTGGNALFLLELGAVPGGPLELKQTTTLPLPFSEVTAIVVLSDPDRIVVASGRDHAGGVWWSPLPQPATEAGAYDWQPALGLEPGQPTGLAAGPGDSVVVALLQKSGLAGLGGSSHGDAKLPVEIHRGTFDGEALVFAQSRIDGVDPSLLRETSLASCDDDPMRMYAAAAGKDGALVAVLASVDGGATWQARSTPDPETAGLRGFYNNCIAVSPQNPDRVVVGWQNAAPFWSDDGAGSWRQPHQAESAIHLHKDLHALHFARNPDGPERLYVGGDGGIVVSPDLGATYHSHFNQPLHNLQFYGGARSTFLGSLAGALTASSRYPGLLAGGTQDNGNLYRRPDGRGDGGARRQAESSWFQQAGGDGDLNRFVDPLGVLLNFNNSDPPRLGLAPWNEESRLFLKDSRIVLPADGDEETGEPIGIAPTAVEVVTDPAFRKEGQLLFAVAAAGEGGALYGLAADDPGPDDPPGAKGARLRRLGTAGSRVSALASRDGASVLVGLEDGRILSLDCASGALTGHALPDLAKGAVSRLEAFPPPGPAGVLPDPAFALVGDRIFFFNGLFWAAAAGTDWVTFAWDGGSDRLFAATDGDVFVSADRGASWSDASFGLPARPHCADLRVADDGHGGRDLYLATYGRSVWRATIARKPEILELPRQMVEILIGVLEDGGGLVRRGNKIVKIPPRPVLRDVLAALVAENAANTLPEGSEARSRTLRRAELKRIAEIVLAEAERLR